MAACREGGAAIEQALRRLDHDFFALMFRECSRVLRDGDLALDVVQETFIKVWQRCATYRGESEVLPWIRVILRRGILDRIRRGHAELVVEPERMEELLDGGAAVVSESRAEPEDAARRAELQAVFERCWREFERVSPAHAAVMTWIVDDGLSHEEIGTLLERTPGATREFISQCRKRARRHLAEWYALAFTGGAST